MLAWHPCVSKNVCLGWGRMSWQLVCASWPCRACRTKGRSCLWTLRSLGAHKPYNFAPNNLAVTFHSQDTTAAPSYTIGPARPRYRRAPTKQAFATRPTSDHRRKYYGTQASVQDIRIAGSTPSGGWHRRLLQVELSQQTKQAHAPYQRQHSIHGSAARPGAAPSKMAGLNLS